jgi:exodeoxyribonuclease-5
LEVTKVLKRFERYGISFAEVEVKFADAPESPVFEVCINLSILESDLPQIPYAETQALEEAIGLDYVHLGSKTAIRKAVKADPCFQALQVKFGWAMTCHKAQGGQWPMVLIDPGYLTEDSIDLGMDALALHGLHAGPERTGAFEFCRCLFQRLTPSLIALSAARNPAGFGA